MNRIKNSCTGFSIVELMVAMLTFSVMIMVVGAMIVYSWRGWIRSNEAVNMQREASLAMMIMPKEIRNAAFDEVTDGEGIISFSVSGVSFSESGNDIVRNDGFKVVDGLLVPGSFETRKRQVVKAGKTNQWVEINFTLATTTETEPYSAEISPRN